MSHRLLVMGDNHGDAGSLRRVLDDVEGEPFDVAVHVGDFTDAWRTARREDDRRKGKRRGVEQLRAVEPLLEEFDDRAEGGLAWVYGNQDYFGDLDYKFEVGTEVPRDGRATVGGLEFTGHPEAVSPGVVLVTHMEFWRLLDGFDGLAHFCGNTHRGRHLGRRLNAAFLSVTDPETGRETKGGYFLVELDGGGIDVEMRSIGDLERVDCERHRERGVQFQPSFRGCMYCRDRRILMRELCATAFYRLAGGSNREAVAADELCEHALGLWDDPPDDLGATLREYLAGIDDDRYAPLTWADGDRLTLADRSYAY